MSRRRSRLRRRTRDPVHRREHYDAPVLRTGKASAASPAVVDYEATDNDGETKDSAVAYSLEGADDDEDSFTISDTEGTLTAATAFRANFEDQSSYSLVIVATTTGANNDAAGRGSKIGKLSVTVNVVDQEDAGSVDLSAREPQVGRSVIATLDDPDGGETAYRGSGTGVAPTQLQTLMKLGVR